MINIDELIKQSLRSGNKEELKAYRNLKAEFQAVKTSKNYKGEWTDELELQIISKYAKKLDAAICDFGASNSEVKSEYINELEIIKKLLPESVNESDIYNLFEDERISKDYLYKFWEDDGENINIEIPKKEMGTVIKYLKSKFPTADGKIISEIVKSYIV